MATTKQQQNRKKFTKEYKIKEIQKSLTKKARLRKGYLKALKEEGYSIPDKRPTSIPNKPSKNLNGEENRRNFEQKKEIIQQRKKSHRDALEERKKNDFSKLKEAKEKLQEREKRRVKLAKRTKSGQPLMGPRIEDLLSKIKEDETYTN